MMTGVGVSGDAFDLRAWGDRGGGITGLIGKSKILRNSPDERPELIQWANRSHDIMTSAPLNLKETIG